MKSLRLIGVLLAVAAPTAAQPVFRPDRSSSAAPVLYWSNEARRAIVPPGPNGMFGAENYGNKFPGEAAVYMGIVHMAMHDAARALVRPVPSGVGTRPAQAPSAAAAIATAAYRTLLGLQPALGLTAPQQAALDERYRDYMAHLTDYSSTADGIALGEQVALEVLAGRANDGRDANPQLGHLNPPAAAPGVWESGTAAALGLRLPGMRPLALASSSQFRPDGPSSLAGGEYANDYEEVAGVGRADSTARTAADTAVALFWTDHDLRQWNDGLLALATARHLDLMQTARMLAMAHVAGGDAMIACFDAKYAYWFWRPYQAIPRGARDGNAATEPDPSWRPLGATPNFPEYPSAHACHSAAIIEALTIFFGTDRVRFSLTSRVTGTTREYARLGDVVREVESARVLVGFHFRNSDREGSKLGRRVARYVTANRFRVGRHEGRH